MVGNCSCCSRSYAFARSIRASSTTAMAVKDESGGDEEAHVEADLALGLRRIRGGRLGDRLRAATPPQREVR